MVIATGGDAGQTFEGLSRLQPVRGRLERAALNREGAPVYVDYAHTADALEAAIAALRPHLERQLIVVFGAGGDRDQGKRVEMGRVAEAQADVVIVTDDNPRSEDPASIRAAIMREAGAAKEVAGREEAIYLALKGVSAGDIVVIAGKGHEKTQIIGEQHLPFDDAEVAQRAARELGLA